MIVGRAFPSARTTASAIESTAKGATGPEEAVETTNGAGDDTGNSSERRPADKLLLVERGGLGIMYNQNKKPVKSEGTTYQRNTTAGEETTVGDWRNSAWLFLVVDCFTPTGNRYTGPAKKTTLSDQQTPNCPATSERRASRDEPEKTTVVSEENSFKSPTKEKATLGQPKRHAIRATSITSIA